MAVRGVLLPKPGTEGTARAKRAHRFLVRSTDLEVDAESVSSEWTSDSETSAGRGRSLCRRRLRPIERVAVRKWRLRHDLLRHERWDASGQLESSSGDDAKSSASDPRSAKSSNSDDSRADDGQDERVLCTSSTSTLHVAPEIRIDRSVVHSGGVGKNEIQWFGPSQRYRCLGFVPSFLSEANISAIESAAQHFSVREVFDRKKTLTYKHRVTRFEMQLRALQPELYARVLALMRRADGAKWRRLRATSEVLYPEIEHIEYNVEREGGPCFIAPHRDNKSAVTLVVMLSAPSAYDGGLSCFRRSGGRSGHREVALRLGDAVLFRGERLLHWVSPVTAGRRVVLQVELSRE